jgi:hypothetical protein
VSGSRLVATSGPAAYARRVAEFGRSQSKLRDGLTAGASSSATDLRQDPRWKTWYPKPGEIPPSLIFSSSRCYVASADDLVEWETLADTVTGRMRRETGTVSKVRDDGYLEVSTLVIDEHGRARVGKTIVSAHIVKVMQRAGERRRR